MKLDLIARFNAKFHSDGPAAAISACGTEDFIWWAQGHGEVQDSVDAIMAVMRAHFDADRMTMNVVGLTVEGDRAALETEGRGTLRDGRTYDNLFHTLYVLRDNRIAGLREYHATAHAAEYGL